MMMPSSAGPPPLSPATDSGGRSTTRTEWLGLCLLLGVAGLMRWGASGRGLWLDELWTLGPDVLGKITQPWQVFTTIHHENNHYINTLVGWGLGPGHAAWKFRFPSVLAGMLTVACGWSIGRRRSPGAAWLLAIVLAVSYPLVHYGSEARGYALAVAGALAGVDLRERLWTRPRALTAFAAGLVETLGLLAQPVLICHLAGLAAVVGWLAWQRTSGQDRRALWQLAVLALPGSIFAVLYWIDLSRAFNPGGPVFPLAEVQLQLLSLVVGGPLEGPGVLAAGVLGGLLLMVVAWWGLRKEPVAVWTALLGGVVVPSLVLVIEARHEVYPRYFLVAITAAQMLVSLAMVTAWNSGGWKRAAVLVGVVLWGGATAAHLVRLWSWGRGDASEIVELLVRESRQKPIRYATDHDFRLRMFVDEVFVRRGWEPPPPPVRPGATGEREPEWLLTHDFRIAPTFPESLVLGRVTWHLRGVSRYAGLSGWSTAVYSRD